MARLVHLVRHGEVDNPHDVVYASLPGFGLTERGRRQARAAARFLGSQPVVAIWSSPLERAMETAAVIAGRFQLPIQVEPELIEWRLSDDWAGLGWEELATARPGQLEAYLTTPADLPFASEPLPALAKRMTAVLRELHRRHHDGDVVVVGHQDPIQAARLSILGRDLADLQSDKPGHCSVVTLQPGNAWKEVSLWHPPGEEHDSPEPLEELGVGLEGEGG